MKLEIETAWRTGETTWRVGAPVILRNVRRYRIRKNGTLEIALLGDTKITYAPGIWKRIEVK